LLRRRRLGLRRGRPVEISERAGHIEIEAAATPMALVRRARRCRKGKIEALTDDIVRDTLERTRR
jgi:bifunctional DNA-binding transcriptional regulator/antitoxin component of YhaV-PrlF toxin-antitoxin module